MIPRHDEGTGMDRDPVSTTAGADARDITAGSPRRSAVMGDVAALAGVSQMTVSRVINDRPGVRDETRRRVLRAMQELDYRPNVAARALVTGRSKTLGVVSFDTTLYGPASTLFGIEVAARDAGYFVSIATLASIDRRALGDAVERLREQAVDGVIVIAPHDATVEGLRDLAVDVPLVAVEGGVGGGAPVATVDQYTGAARATSHLLSLGHETVWHISGPVEWPEARARERAWRETLSTAGCRVPDVLVGDWSARSGYTHGKTLIEADDATAVFVANDHMALGLLRALHEAGLRVPADLSVVGFDDVPEAAFFSPPLTTVRQDFAEVGRRAMRQLLDQLEGRTRPADAVIEPDLVLRESTGKAPANRHPAAGSTTPTTTSRDGH
jgi:DNA-binding LacI/PurR family transcriptional regulator